MTSQYLRKVSLIVTKDGKGLDLSEMAIEFQVYAPDTNAPPTAYIRVWNLKKDTASKIQKEFDQVALQAGYSDPAVIFQGTIVQVKKGAASAIDYYVDIMASDLDLFFNNVVVNKTLAKGSSPADQVKVVTDAAAAQGAETGYIPSSLGTGGVLPRGKVLFGMGRDYMDDVARTTDTSWFVQNGKINVIKKTGYLPGDIVSLNSATGMLGVPEATENGIEVRCLLNPRIKVGGRVKINNADIATTTVKQPGLFPTYGAINLPANLSADGVYRVLVVEHMGGNRINQFESRLTCLAVDSTAAADSSVKTSG